LKDAQEELERNKKERE